MTDDDRCWHCNKCDQEWYTDELDDYHRCPDCGCFCGKIEADNDDDPTT